MTQRDEKEFDVIVVGGGPAGSACSTFLSLSGLKVLLIDKAKFPRDKICGDCINPHAWHVFELLGVSDELRHHNLRAITSVRIANMAGKNVSIGISQNSSTPYVAVKRKDLDQMLLKNAMRVGVTVVEQGRVVDIAHLDAWDVSVQQTRILEHFHARYLVGADGRNSFVAGKINARVSNFLPSKMPIRVGVQWHAAFQSKVGSEIQLYKFKSGYCGIVNVDGRTANIAMVTTPELAHLALSDFPQFLKQTMLQNPSCARTCINLNPLDGIHSTFPITPLARHCRRTDAFLIGDARRTVEPFTGEGICLALQDGILTAAHILKLCGKESEPLRFPRRSSFWVNRIYSPLLRRHQVSESLISLAANHSWISRMLGKTVLQ